MWIPFTASSICCVLWHLSIYSCFFSPRSPFLHLSLCGSFVLTFKWFEYAVKSVIFYWFDVRRKQVGIYTQIILPVSVWHEIWEIEIHRIMEKRKPLYFFILNQCNFLLKDFHSWIFENFTIFQRNWTLFNKNLT